MLRVLFSGMSRFSDRLAAAGDTYGLHGIAVSLFSSTQSFIYRIPPNAKVGLWELWFWFVLSHESESVSLISSNTALLPFVTGAITAAKGMQSLTYMLVVQVAVLSLLWWGLFPTHLPAARASTP